ncbi:hypothetical protein YC2023_087093 [Brassica napus]
MPPTFFLLQHIYNRLKLRMRSNTPGLSQHHPPLNISLLNPPKQQPNVIPSQSLIENLLKHFDPSDGIVPSLPQPN